MKVTVEQEMCDLCGKNEAYPHCACLRCGKFICYECVRLERAERYDYSINASGGGDGWYCSGCVEALRKDPDELFTAYQHIRLLKAARKAFYEDFTKRADQAEALVLELHKERTKE